MYQNKEMALGVDIGGTKIKVGLVDSSGCLAAHFQYAKEKSKLSDFTKDLQKRTSSFLLEQNVASSQLCALGVGVRGLVDDRRQKLVFSSIFEAIDCDLMKALSTAFGMKAFIENDVNAATLAELRWGIGASTDSFVYSNLGTGFAMGFVDRGHLIRGAHNAAGEAGSLLFEPENARGSLKEIETILSGEGFRQEARRLCAAYPKSSLNQNELLRAENVFSACQAGDELACSVLQTALRQLSLILINTARLLEPNAFVFGGGLVNDGGWFLQQIKTSVQNMSLHLHSQWTLPMELSCLGAADVGLLGAAAVAFNGIQHQQIEGGYGK